jgi:hypothetical protein
MRCDAGERSFDGLHHGRYMQGVPMTQVPEVVVRQHMQKAPMTVYNSLLPSGDIAFPPYTDRGSIYPEESFGFSPIGPGRFSALPEGSIAGGAEGFQGHPADECGRSH